MRKDRDGSLDGRLNMSNHRISGLAYYFGSAIMLVTYFVNFR